ncbi:MAG: hypothetical protein A3J67_00065 [Parcubacteria group bacterium RIFCSPHIGHO2_02_FULL_48_10b]|nr:MAG: hypothetical protein A3J67_00065 [Parcubacteria group bacterium RIFCSPHIGHO2_02_FULL_48_10b]
MFPSINRFIIYLIYANLFFEAGFGLIAPVFAVFIIDGLIGATLATVGFATALYWVPKAVFQIFVARYLDKTQGEKDDFYALVVGHIILAFVPFLYLFIRTPDQLYLVQMIMAVGGALAMPPWFAMFTKHIDKSRENYEWSINSSLSFGLGAGVLGAVGGIIAKYYGFDAVFVVAGAFAIASAMLLLPLYKYLSLTAPRGLE